VVRRASCPPSTVVKLEKKGERGVLTIDAKFLHDKEY
jgi:hypothetical protein